MCNFLSAVYLRTGKLICNPEYTDSHNDLLRAHKIEERETDAPVQQFVRLELLPPDEFDPDPSTWRESVDDHEVPAWFDEAARFDAFAQMRDVVAGMIIDGEENILLGGCWILTGDARVTEAKDCRIIALYDSSSIGTLRGSSRVDELRDSANIDELCDSSRVGTLRDSSSVGVIYDSASIGTLYGSSSVGELCDSASVENDKRTIAKF